LGPYCERKFSFESNSLLAEKLAVLKQFWIKEEERQATDKVKIGARIGSLLAILISQEHFVLG